MYPASSSPSRQAGGDGHYWLFLSYGQFHIGATGLSDVLTQDHFQFQRPTPVIKVGPGNKLCNWCKTRLMGSLQKVMLTIWLPYSLPDELSKPFSKTASCRLACYMLPSICNWCSIHYFQEWSKLVNQMEKAPLAIFPICFYKWKRRIQENPHVSCKYAPSRGVQLHLQQAAALLLVQLYHQLKVFPSYQD